MRDDPRAEADLAEQTNVSGVPKDREGDQTNADTQTNQANVSAAPSPQASGDGNTEASCIATYFLKS